MNRIAVFAICFLLGTGTLLAQQPRTLPNSTMTNGPSTSPMTNPFAAARNTGPRPYNEVITPKAKTNKGLFTVHYVDDKYYFEIPDSILGREMLIVNRISKSAAGSRSGSMMGYAGDEIGENEISFEKGQNNKIFIRKISYQESARDSAGMFQSVRNSNLLPIIAAFDIKAFSRDSVTGSKGSVVEVTDYIMNDNDVFFFDANVKRAMGLNQYQRDNSYIVGINSFSDNVEMKTVKTYLRSPVAGFGQAASPVASFGAPGTPTTYELNSSMVLLPKTTMRPRYFDPRVGYFATGYTDYDENPQGIQQVRMITRWRLEPKPEDVEKYMKGELVEPVKQIVYYIDPSTPRKWVPYLIQGVNDWNVAFEKAGFKNAITARVAPLKDSTWSIEGANHSAIVYKPSDVANASGPHVHDPRSGEILETHINWYHNVMNLVRNWYFIQTAAVDPRARTMQFPDSLMGQLIRFVSSHEVGHTLGLRHNYGSSSTVPVEKLRDKAWVEANGHTPSIMDYARFNYVAQPEDNVSEKGLFPRIGDYDKWAIEWGYRWMPEAKTPQAEIPILNKLTTEKLKNKRFMFGTESDPDDPREQNEDLGDDAMKASAYGIKNLQRIIVKLPEWTRQPNKDYSDLEELYGQLTTQFGRYMGHVAKNIGGIMTTPKTVEQQGSVVEYVSKAKQKEAMAFLQEQLFKTPKWLINSQITSLMDNTSPFTTISRAQDPTLSRLLSNSTFEKLLRFEAEGSNAYTATEMLSDLKKGIWSELPARQPIDIYRRNLQKSFVEKLINIVMPNSGSAVTIAVPTQGRGGFGASTAYSKTSDVMSIAKMQLRSLASEIRSALPSYTDMASRAHLQDELDRINEALNPAK